MRSAGKTVPTRYRLKYEGRLLEHYLETLYENGVARSSYTMEQLKYHYERGVFYIFMFWIVGQCDKTHQHHPKSPPG